MRLARNIAFISEGTPGRENRVVLDCCIFTPGAVPTGFGRGTEPCGRVAILVRYLEVWACFRVFDNDLSQVPTLPCSVSSTCRGLVIFQPTSCRHVSDPSRQL